MTAALYALLWHPWDAELPRALEVALSALLWAATSLAGVWVLERARAAHRASQAPLRAKPFNWQLEEDLEREWMER